MSGAAAHANYKSSAPAKGEVLSASPTRVSITFTQEVQKLTGTFGIDVAVDGGAPVTLGDATLDDSDRSIMTVALEPSLNPGRYVVRWKNVSDSDGDTAEGAFSFYVGSQPSADDLVADEALLKIGAEETPQPTPGASTPEDAITEPPPSSTAVAPAAEESGGGNSSLIIVAVIVIAGIAFGFAVVRWLTRRRA